MGRTLLCSGIAIEGVRKHNKKSSALCVAVVINSKGARTDYSDLLAGCSASQRRFSAAGRVGG